MPAQDALTLKWALERGLNIDLALRSQGDLTDFLTTSVSLPQIITEGGLTTPEETDIDVHPAIREEEELRPYLPPEAPVD